MLPVTSETGPRPRGRREVARGMRAQDRFPVGPGGTPATPRPRRWRARVLVAALAGFVSVAPPAAAQPYASFAVPDSLLPDALRAAGARFEPAWDALLVAELRASLADADSAARLRALAGRVAAAEGGALGTRIAADALARRARWSAPQRRRRVAAAVDESLATAARAARSFIRADSLFGAALAAYREVGEARRAAWVWGSLGGLAFDRRDWVAADSLYRDALAARRAIGDARLIGNALNTLGSIAYELRRYEQAWDLYREARAIRARIGDAAALGATLGLLANLAVAEGRADSAAAYFQQALALTVAHGDSGRTQEVLNSYGAFLRRGADPAAALPLFLRSLAIRRQQGDPGAQAQSLSNIGDLLGQFGRFHEALARLSEARALAIRAGDDRRLREALLNLGRVWVGLGDSESARPPLERSAAIADSLGDRGGEADALNNLAIAALRDGDGGGAERLALRALAAARAIADSARIHDIALTLGDAAFERGDDAAAERWFERAAGAGALEAGQRAGDLVNLGAVAARRGRLDEADARFVHALALAEEARAPDIVWPALLGRGDVAERRGDHAGALAFDRRAAAMIEGLRAGQGVERLSMRLLSQRIFAFEALVHLLTRLQPRYPDSAYAAEAFLWSERARARSFLDLVAAAGGEGRPARPLTLGETQGLLDSDRQAMLAYSVGDSSTSLWVITRRAWRHVALPSRRALRARVEILRRGLGDPRTASAPGTQAAARALYRTLVEPALPLPGGVDHLIVVPDGILARVPFEALLAADPAADGPPPRGAYLVERFAVSYAPSASALATRLDAIAGAGTGGIVALGDPAFAAAGGVSSLASLPFSGDEVARLAAAAGRRPVLTLTGREATRERLLALTELPRAVLLHLATHGEANELEPERSGLWLADGGGGPGFLSTADILGLRLEAGLVTLSACESGLGRLERGEGVLGLSRAFLAAGARGVVVSLWKVNDRSTASLMEGFYRPLLRDRASAAAALARAKRALLRREATRSPFHWAPFVLVGRSGPLDD